MATQTVKDISQGVKSERFTPTVQKSAAYWRAFLADCGPPPPQYPNDHNGYKNMAGYKLRALLDDAEFCSNLVNGGNAQLSLLGNREDDKKKKLSDGVFDPSSASLFRNNIWDQEGNTDDFNLEYMDLDEFLTETGLVDDQNFANIMSNSRPEAPSNPAQPREKQTQNVRLSNLEKLLMSGGGDGDNNRVASPSSSEGGVVSVTDCTQQMLPTTIDKTESTIKDKEDDKPSTGITLTADQIVKKRKYSEDGEGLGETSVVVVPGQEGFDPSAAKFAPEELQPQPIIKKSKKQFVPEDSKDEKYWKRRNKNNVAAKRSREARRAKENQIIMRAGFLESENERLTGENIDLKSENSRLKDIIEELRNK